MPLEDRSVTASAAKSSLSLAERSASWALAAAFTLAPSILMLPMLAPPLADGPAQRTLTTFTIPVAAQTDTRPKPQTQPQSPKRQAKASKAKADPAVQRSKRPADLAKRLDIRPAIVLADHPAPTMLKVSAPPSDAPAPAEPENPGASDARTKETPGTASSAQAAASGGANAAQQDQYGRSVHLRIRAHQRYSRPLVRSGLHGTVVLTFGITHRGHLHHPGIVETSGSRVLDRVALGQLKSAAPFPPPPNGRPRRFTIPLTYRTQR